MNDYEFTYAIPKTVNQMALDESIKAIVGSAFMGTTIMWNDISNNVAARVIVHSNRVLTEGELNAIAGS